MYYIECYNEIEKCWDRGDRFLEKKDAIKNIRMVIKFYPKSKWRVTGETIVTKVYRKYFYNKS